MEQANVEDVKKQEILDDSPKNEVDCDNSVDDIKESDNDKNDESPMPSSHQEEEAIKKKYGGMLPKKPPLISKVTSFSYLILILQCYSSSIVSSLCVCVKFTFEIGLFSLIILIFLQDHERAFFDSADWALGKQGEQKPKGPLEALRPKLQPTQQQARSRRSAYAPADDCEVDGCNASSEDQSTAEDVGSDKSDTAQDQSCR
ncbi:uncharacterized protein LOC133309574 isoform X1 [Gastrolobium bilobum]|uniref:uncharacterized protein LOC133309574 isoform X1 n=1 Tax=Gastrolobium bilobum TaxID=150636 RepID=UPI002AB0DC75|nr:uncharacterized protein LOC133309574 isoform X1 [Gastrolobium bilobum]XP_061366343.1 uncharacterized protein LOC133309574 isoform X1 [Gastrolobium bilobum]